jgi:uncharacterized protein (TIGR03663 family)
VTRTWWTAVVYIAALALFLRFFDLALKPLHHDEAVNTLFLTGLVRPPHAYKYDPGNYHGPTLFYFGWLSVSVFGMTTEAIRIVTASAGLGLVLMLLLLNRQLGIAGSRGAAAMIAVSPGAVYFSRYFIHEMLLVCFTLGVVICVVLWWTRKRPAFLCLAAVSAGLMFATKETAIISAAVLCIAAFGAAILVETAGVVRSGGRTRLLPRTAAEIAAQSRSFLRGVGERAGLRSFVIALAIFLVVELLFYTSFFTHWRGAVDALRTFAIWTKTGTTDHTHPWPSYLDWLRAEELTILVGGVIGIALAIWRSTDRFAVFAALWAVGILTAYSLIPYKTPWLTLNAIVPLAICAGYALQVLWADPRVPRIACWTIVAAALGYSAYTAVVLSFWQYDNDQSPYVYAHTSREVLDLVRAVEGIEADHPQTAIAVTSRDQFPLSWYLRDFPAGYYGNVAAPRTPLVIASVDQQNELEARLGAQFDRLGPYRLRPGVRLVLYVQRDLRRPVKPSS